MSYIYIYIGVFIPTIISNTMKQREEEKNEIVSDLSNQTPFLNELSRIIIIANRNEIFFFKKFVE